MISKATDAFWKAYRGLPDEIKQRARTAYRLWQENPAHPSLRFKQIHATEPIYSVRIGLGWRAVGVRSGEEMLWYWIGSHSDYDTLVSLFRRNVELQVERPGHQRGGIIVSYRSPPFTNTFGIEMIKVKR